MGRHGRFLLLASVFCLFSFSAFAQLVTPRLPGRRAEPPSPTASAAELEQRGDQLRADKAYLDALDYYTASLKKKRSAGGYNKAGICELMLLHYGPAQNDFGRAIKLDRNFAEAYNNRGAVFYVQEKYGKAVKEYRKALKLREDSASFHANLGMAYLESKKYPEMSVEFVRALQLDPGIFEHRSQTGISAQISSPEDQARYNYFLAKVYAQTGDSDDALRCLRKALEDGYKGINEVYKDAEFTALRKDPRFIELMAQKPPAIPQ